MSFEQHPINVLNAAGAPDFVTIDAQELLDLAKAHFEEGTGRTLSPSQVEMYLLETIAYMLSVRGAEEQLGIQDCFVAYARPERLADHGADRNTPRLEASAATTTLKFSTENPAIARITLPAETRVADVSGQVQFLTLDPAYIDAGETSVDVRAKASVTGISANGFPIGSLTSIVTSVPGIDGVENLTETGGGAEQEGLDRYRARIALAFERIGYGLNKERYVSDVLGWNARCVDVGVDRPRPGEVHLFPLMDTGAANPEELTSLLAVFDASNIHQGDFIQVFEAQPHLFAFDLVLTLTDASAETQVRASVQSLLDQWSRVLGGFVAPSQIVCAAKISEQVVDADVPNLQLEAVAANSWRKCTGFNVIVQAV